MTSATLTETLIDSVAEFEAFLSSIPSSSTIYLDLEGTNLSRHGTISLMTVLIYPQRNVRLIDISVLGKAAFTTATNDGKTLKTILEDPNVPKCAWDIRNDAGALWALYQVGLAGVTDIQLLENASRNGAKTYVCGLDKAIQSDLSLGFMATNRWIRTKKEVQGLMGADVFAVRPIDAKTISYCVNDVIHLPDLHMLHLSRISGDWLAKAVYERPVNLGRIGVVHGTVWGPRHVSTAWSWRDITSINSLASSHVLMYETFITEASQSHGISVTNNKERLFYFSIYLYFISRTDT